MTRQLKKCRTLTLLPPKPEVCQTCASDHEPEEPHDQRSLYYQYSFFAEHGRWPSWADAMAHCSAGMRVMWSGELRKLGVKV